MARLLSVLTCLAGFGLATAAPAAAAQGVTVEITELPGQFTAGASPQTITVVATKRSGNCIKVRWSLVLRVAGVTLDRVRVDRIEDSGSFPTDKRIDGNTARITDQQVDPGTLCQNRTVTARYNVSFNGDATDAQVTFSPEAFAVGNQLLDRTTVTRTVVGAGAQAAPSATAAPDPTETAQGDPAGAGLPAGEQTDAPATGNPNPVSERSSVIRVAPVGLAVGAVLVFAGFGLLLKVRRRLRARPAGRPGQRDVWYSATARRRKTSDGAWRARAGLPPHPAYGDEPLPAPVTAPVGAASTRRTTQERGKSRPTLTLPPLRR